MSVINQMLRDLNQHQPLNQPELDSVKATSKSGNSLSRYSFKLLWVLLIGAVIAILVWSYRLLPILDSFLNENSIVDSVTDNVANTKSTLKKQSINNTENIPVLIGSQIANSQTKDIATHGSSVPDSQLTQVAMTARSDIAKSDIAEPDAEKHKAADLLKVTVQKNSLAKSSGKPSTEEAHQQSTLPVTASVPTKTSDPVKANQIKNIAALSTDNINTEITDSSKTNSRTPSQDKTINEPQISVQKNTNTLSAAEQAQTLWRQANRYPNQEVSLLKQALKLAPDLEGARTQLIALLISQGKTRQANILLDDGLRLFPKQAQLVEWKARILIAEKQPIRARQWLLKLQPELKTHISYYGLLAGLLSQQKQFEQAANQYQQLTKAQPEHGPWWLGLAIAEQRMNKLESAKQSFQQARQSSGLTSKSRQYVNQQLKKLESRDGN